MSPDLLFTHAADLVLQAGWLLAALVTGFAIALGVALFACGALLMVLDLIEEVRTRRAPRAGHVFGRMESRR